MKGKIKYEQPQLISLSKDPTRVEGACTSGSGDSANCVNGSKAGANCSTGTSAPGWCAATGNSAGACSTGSKT